jgi:hypothetical protein
VLPPSIVKGIRTDVRVVFDTMLSTVGDIDPESVHTKLQLQRPNIRIRDPDSGKIVEKITSNVPDLLSLHGKLYSPSLSSCYGLTASQAL